MLFDVPVLFDLELALQGVALPFRWRPDNGARVGLLPRTGTGADVVWIDVEPCFVYHPLNAFDDGDRWSSTWWCTTRPSPTTASP